MPKPTTITFCLTVTILIFNSQSLWQLLGKSRAKNGGYNVFAMITPTLSGIYSRLYLCHNTLNCKILHTLEDLFCRVKVLSVNIASISTVMLRAAYLFRASACYRWYFSNFFREKVSKGNFLRMGSFVMIVLLLLLNTPWPNFTHHTNHPPHSLPSLPAAAATLWRCGDKNSGHFQFFSYAKYFCMKSIPYFNYSNGIWKCVETITFKGSGQVARN